jgi:hypothetical protein
LFAQTTADADQLLEKLRASAKRAQGWIAARAAGRRKDEAVFDENLKRIVEVKPGKKAIT